MKSNDQGITIPKAKEAIEEMETVEEIKAYIEGEERSGVLNFAEARIKEIEDAGGEGDPDGEDNGEGKIAERDTFLYHKTEEPRVFKAGEKIPAGWTLDNDVRALWNNLADGKWQKVG